MPVLALPDHFSYILRLEKALGVEKGPDGPDNYNLEIDFIWTLSRGSEVRNCVQTLEIPVLELTDPLSHILRYEKAPEAENGPEGSKNSNIGIDLLGWSMSNKEEAASVSGAGHDVSRRRPERDPAFQTAESAPACR